MNKILLIEDDLELGELIMSELTGFNVGVELIRTLEAAKESLMNFDYSLVLVDLNLPDGKGIELLEVAKNSEKNSNVPVLIMTGVNDVKTKVEAFAKGVEDYIVKPFDFLELKARIDRRLLKQSEFEKLEIGPITLDYHTQSVKLLGIKSPIYLTPREFKILHLLAKNPKQTYSREMILKKIWGEGIHVTNRTVDAHICYLRKKLDRYCHIIRSSAGEGYRFQA